MTGKLNNNDTNRYANNVIDKLGSDIAIKSGFLFVPIINHINIL